MDSNNFSKVGLFPSNFVACLLSYHVVLKANRGKALDEMPQQKILGSPCSSVAKNFIFMPGFSKQGTYQTTFRGY